MWAPFVKFDDVTIYPVLVVARTVYLCQFIAFNTRPATRKVYDLVLLYEARVNALRSSYPSNVSRYSPMLTGEYSVT